MVEQAPHRAFQLVGDHHGHAVDALDEGLGLCHDLNGILPGDGVLIIQELTLQTAADQLSITNFK